MTTTDRSSGAIVVNSHSSGQRRRFTVGHELGHFLNAWHQPSTESGFECTRSDMALATYQSLASCPKHQRQEIEANRFAIELLTPRSRLQPYLSPTPDLEHALRIAADFDISREAGVRRYVALHEANLAVAFSRNGVLSYMDRGREFPAIALRKGDPMPPLSAPSIGLSRSAMEDVDRSEWLRHSQRARLQAQTLHQQNGYRTTILLAEADDEEDEGEGPDDLVDRFTRFHGMR